MPKLDEPSRRPLAVSTVSAPVPSGLSPFAEHCRRWAGGCGAEICASAYSRCYARGSIPCDVLFVGEAPGESEDSLGVPFCGPAGKLMDQMVEEAMEPWQGPGGVGPGCNAVSWAFTNLVLCIPRDPSSGGKAGEPMPEDIRACGPRLAEIVAIAAPKLIICVGALSREWTRGRTLGSKSKRYDPLGAAGYTGAVADVEHPAYILRLNVAMRGLAIQKVVVTVREAVAAMRGE